MEVIDQVRLYPRTSVSHQSYAARKWRDDSKETNGFRARSTSLRAGRPCLKYISEMFDNSALRKVFNLEGSVKFENHSNTVSTDDELQDGLQRMTVSGIKRRRSPHLAAKDSSIDALTFATSPTSAGTTKCTAYPRADQFCVYNISTGVQHADVRIPVFVVEYRPPHKLSSGHIYEGLSEVDLDDLLSYKDTDGTKEHCQRLVTAAITQAFSYMIRAGLEFGCVRNGEASIFLQIPETNRVQFSTSCQFPKETSGNRQVGMKTTTAGIGFISSPWGSCLPSLSRHSGHGRELTLGALGLLQVQQLKDRPPCGSEALNRQSLQGGQAREDRSGVQYGESDPGTNACMSSFPTIFVFLL